jgi:arsenate reductase
MEKLKVLFVCIHNSARSQMAEAWLNKLYGERFDGYSAGMEPGVLNPLAVQMMQEAGVDISGNKTKGVFDFVKSDQIFSYVITVCDDANAEQCPVFPGIAKRLHWSFPDPAPLSGTEEEKLTAIRTIRDDIRKAVVGWCSSLPI